MMHAAHGVRSRYSSAVFDADAYRFSTTLLSKNRKTETPLPVQTRRTWLQHRANSKKPIEENQKEKLSYHRYQRTNRPLRSLVRQDASTRTDRKKRERVGGGGERASTRKRMTIEQQ